jgi:hypothetical protein
MEIFFIRRQTMTEISAEVLQQLEQAQADLMQRELTSGPPTAPEAMMQPAAAGTLFGAAGSGQAVHVLEDHYFTGSLRRIYVYAGNTWRYRNVTDAEEQGLAQVLFGSTRVDAWWDDSNVITMLRCWKTF